MKKDYSKIKEYIDEIVAFSLAILSVILFMLLNNNKELVYFLDSGSSSIFQFAFVAIVISVFVCAILGLISPHERNELNEIKAKSKFRYILASIPIVIGYVFLALLMEIVVGFFVALLFPGLQLRTFTAALLIGATVFASGHWVYGRVSKFNLRKACNMFILVFLASLIISIAFVGVNEWWAYNISFLGGNSSHADRFFNLTTVYSGILLIIVNLLISKRLKYLLDLDLMTKRKYKIAVISGYFLGILFIGVGLFQYIPGTLEATFHNLSAYTLATLFTAIMFLSGYLFPFLGKRFYIMSIICGLAMVFSGILFVFFGYFNNLGAELAAYFFALLWGAFFIKALKAKVRNTKKEEAKKRDAKIDYVKSGY